MHDCISGAFDEPLALGKVLIDALGNGAELADLVLLLIKGFDDADTADIFLHDVVELIIRAEYARENREYAADNEKQRHREDRQDDEKRHGDITADAERHDHGKNQHDR